MQPTPSVGRSDVERVLARDFPAEQVGDLQAMLDEYGTETWHRERDRVQLAILKLADGDPDRLRANVEVAKTDYRDVLAAAEYPEYYARVPGTESLPPNHLRRTIDADWRQYREWLAR